MDIVRIGSLYEIFELQNRYLAKVKLDSDFWFRGQADCEWILLPTLARLAKQKQLSRAKILKLENNIAMLFAASSSSIVDIEKIFSLEVSRQLHNGRINIQAQWPLLQHFSAPTRVLDWSEQFFVALYFACNSHFESDGGLWVLDIEKSKQYTIKNYPLFKQEHLFGEDSESIVLTMTTFLTNERLEAQSGRFTVGTNPLANHNDFMDMAGSITKVVIPKDLKIDILRKLWYSNVNAKTLFPGIDGLGKYLTEFSLLWDE